MTDHSDPILHAQELIRCRSVTPNQAGALDYLEKILSSYGFICRRLPFGGDDGEPVVDNLYARLGQSAPHLCLAGHIDVVPPGDDAAWTSPPFDALIKDGKLFGRGSVDMKGGVAAMLAAVCRYLNESGGVLPGSISFLMTADEEGPAKYGTRAVVQWMQEHGERPDHCLLGEPTNPDRLGEMIKIGRRGSLSGRLIVRGIQGHVAYPERTNNPLTGLVAALNAITTEKLDEGTQNFAPSNLEVSSIDTGNPTVNVVPAAATARFNVRFNDLHTVDTLSERLRHLIEAPLRDAGLTWELEFSSNADVFLTQPGDWVQMLASASHAMTGISPELSTSGGTSDARFIKDLCPVVEYGLVNKTIHAIDEHTDIADLKRLSEIFHGFLGRYFEH